MKKFIRTFLIISILMLGLSACGKKKNPDTAQQSNSGEEQSSAEAAGHAASKTSDRKDEDSSSVRCISAPSISKEDYPLIDGSTATLPLGRMLYRMTTGASLGEAYEAVSFTKTTNSYIRLMDGEVDLVIAYEAGDSAKSRKEYDDLIVEPIGLDALIFLCNESNPVQSLTSEQIRNIYSGKITNWKDVGGKDQDIMAFQRPVNSGSQTLMQNLMMRDISMMSAPLEYQIDEMGDLIEEVAAYANRGNALGYSVYYYANTMHILPGIRYMQVDGIMPTNDTIRSGEYGYVNPFYVAIRSNEDKNSEAYRLFKWLTGDQGQSLINGLGYVGISNASYEIPEEYVDHYVDAKDDGDTLVLSGEIYDGTAGIIVFDEDLKPSERYDDIRLRYSYAVARENIIIAAAPIYEDHSEESGEQAYYSEADRYGLFNIETGEWVVEPLFSFINLGVDKNGDLFYYYGRYSDSENGETPVYACSLSGDGLTPEYSSLSDVYNHFYYNDTHYYNQEYGENKKIYQLGTGSFAQIYSDDETGTQQWKLYIQGKLYDSSDNGYAAPYDFYSSCCDQMPAGYTHVYFYELDENGDNSWDESRCYIIDTDGNIAAKPDIRDGSYILMNAHSYYIALNGEGHYAIRTMDGSTVFDWNYLPYDQDEMYDELILPMDEVTNNGGNYIKIGDLIYFRKAGEEAMRQASVGGDYSAVNGYDSLICSYNPETEEVTELFQEDGSGGLYASGGRVYSTCGSSESPYVYGTDLTGKYGKWLCDGSISGIDRIGKYMAVTDYDRDENRLKLHIFDQGIRYDTIEGEGLGSFMGFTETTVLYSVRGNDSLNLYAYNIENRKSINIGQLPSEYFEISQLESDGNRFYMSGGVYEGTGHFLSDAYFITGDTTKQGSISYEPVNISMESDSESVPAFVVKNGKMQICDGVPNTAKIIDPYSDGRLVCYDENGKEINIKSGFKTVTDDSDNRVNVECAELIDNNIYLIRNDEAYDAEASIGWRTAYRRRWTYYDIVSTEDKEMGMIDLAEAPEDN